MTRQPLSNETLELVLAIHAGSLELEAIEDLELRRRVRELHAQLQLSAETVDGEEVHLPPWLLAGWPRLGQALSELERTSVESHLGACESCREELLLLDGLRVETARGPRRAHSFPGVWFAGSWALVATAALLVLWFRSPGVGTEPSPELQTLVVPAALRGGEAVPEIRLSAGASRIGLDLGQLYPAPLREELAASGVTRLWLELRGPRSSSGRIVAEMSMDEFSRVPTFAWTLAPGDSLATGLYECAVWLRAEESARIDTRFEIGLVGPD